MGTAGWGAHLTVRSALIPPAHQAGHIGLSPVGVTVSNGFLNPRLQDLDYFATAVILTDGGSGVPWTLLRSASAVCTGHLRGTGHYAMACRQRPIGLPRYTQRRPLLLLPYDSIR